MLQTRGTSESMLAEFLWVPGTRVPLWVSWFVKSKLFVVVVGHCLIGLLWFGLARLGLLCFGLAWLVCLLVCLFMVQCVFDI